jgi:hypothetical protein
MLATLFPVMPTNLADLFVFILIFMPFCMNYADSQDGTNFALK